MGAKETLESQSIDTNATSTTMIFYFLGGNCLSEYLMGWGLINYRKSSVTFSFLLNIDTSLVTTWSFFLESGRVGGHGSASPFPALGLEKPESRGF